LGRDLVYISVILLVSIS